MAGPAATGTDRPPAGFSAGAISMGLIAMLILFGREFLPPLVRSLVSFDAWLGVTLGLAMFWLVAYRSRATPVTPRRWHLTGTVLQLLLTIGVAVMAWTEFQGALPLLCDLIITITMWHIIAVRLAAVTSLRVAIIEVALLTGAISVYLAATPFRNHLAWAVTLPLTAAAVIGLRIYITQAITNARAARIASERAEASMLQALAVVEGERDAKARFIAASHDLQQPQQAARIFFDLAMSMPLGTDRDRAIAGAHAGFDSARALLTSMHDHLRLEAGAVTVSLQPPALGLVLGAAVLAYEAARHAAGMRIYSKLTQLIALADGKLPNCAIGNLVDNAVRHARGENVLLMARRRGDRVAIYGIYDGRGITADDAEQLFDDFALGATDAPGGFGLGLASARRQMASMDGGAAIDVRWQRGAAFVLDLPAAKATKAFALAAE